MAGSFQTAIIKTHSGRSLYEILKETIETGEGKWRDCYVSPRRCQHQTVWCVCGSFYKAFFALTSAEVSPFARLTRCWCVVGNVLARFISAEGREWCASWYARFRTPRQTDYGVLLTGTNCLSVRSEQILLWVSLAGWLKKKKKHSSAMLSSALWNCAMSLSKASGLCINVMLMFLWVPFRAWVTGK